MTATAPNLCEFLTGRGTQCTRKPTAVVPGVVKEFCRQHARIVATAPGASGYVRDLPVGVAAIVADLTTATTLADIDRCRGAIARQIDVCNDQTLGLKPELRQALAEARARVNRRR